MDKLDLNIQNYNLNDILNLFKIPYNFSETDLKNSYKMYIKTHPDKSGLDTTFFLFFEKAYTILEKIYYFRNKKLESRDKYETIPNDDEKKKLLGFLDGKSVSDFNIWFNKMFDKTRVRDDENDTGYGEWYNSYKDKEEERVTLNEFGRIFERKKKETCKDIVVKKELNEMSSGGGFNLDREKPEEYSSDIFSKLQFEDLKKAHTETVVPVGREDFDNVKKFNNIESYKQHRHKQNTKPFSSQQSEEYLKNKETGLHENDTMRIFKILKNDEEVAEKNRKWWGHLKQIQ
jgi:hypothetical protein